MYGVRRVLIQSRNKSKLYFSKLRKVEKLIKLHEKKTNHFHKSGSKKLLAC